jgi:GNAT superfamily N-acetyltransferase
MPPLTQPSAVRALLRQDPIWSVYALGDLAPASWPKALWFTPDLTLLYRDYGVSILFALGTASLAEAIPHATFPLHLQLRPDAFAIASRLLPIHRQHLMHRMAWRRRPAAWPAAASTRRLTPSDLPALERLYADGAASGESPDFFFPSMLHDGVFCGHWEHGELTAAAGTHLYSPAEGVAAIGNVYTRRDRRGRGLARLVTAAVVDALSPLETIALNVRAANAPAIRAYAAIGFVHHCDFYEAVTNGIPIETGTPGHR